MEWRHRLDLAVVIVKVVAVEDVMVAPSPVDIPAAKRFEFRPGRDNIGSASIGLREAVVGVDGSSRATKDGWLLLRERARVGDCEAVTLVGGQEGRRLTMLAGEAREAAHRRVGVDSLLLQKGHVIVASGVGCLD